MVKGKFSPEDVDHAIPSVTYPNEVKSLLSIERTVCMLFYKLTLGHSFKSKYQRTDTHQNIRFYITYSLRKLTYNVLLCNTDF